MPTGAPRDARGHPLTVLADPSPTGAATRIAREARALLGRIVRDDPMAVGAAVIFFVAGLVWLLHPWRPVADLAITEMEVRRVGDRIPLTGPYSYLPMRHPGPALFLTLYPLYWLSGEQSSALLAANLWIVGLFTAAALALARRLAGSGFALLIAAGIAVWSLATGLPILLQPWNPYAGAVPAIFLVLLGWALVEGWTRALPLAIATGSWMVQAHIQFTPMVVAVVGGCGAVLVIRILRTGGYAGRQRLLRAVIAAAAIGLVMWAPPLVDLAVHGRGSGPARIAAYLRDGTDEPAVSRHDLQGVARSVLSARPTWAGGGSPYRGWDGSGTWATPWMLLLLIAAAALTSWRRRWRDLRGTVVATGALGAALVGLSRVTGGLRPWYLVAVEAASITLAAVLLSAVVSAIGETVDERAQLRRPAGEPQAGRGRVWPGRVFAALAVGVLLIAVINLKNPRHETSTAAAADRVLPLIEDRIDGHPVLIEERWGLNGWVYSVVALELDRSGHDVSLRTIWTDRFPADMEDAPPPDAKRFVFLTDPASDVQWDPDVDVIADFHYSIAADDPPVHLVVVEAPLYGALAKKP